MSDNKVETPSYLSDAAVDRHVDAVLRAGGSALRHYSMDSTIQGMRSAMRKALSEAIEAAFSAEGLV